MMRHQKTERKVINGILLENQMNGERLSFSGNIYSLKTLMMIIIILIFLLGNLLVKTKYLSPSRTTRKRFLVSC